MAAASARDLCYLGRFDEAERELGKARAVAAGPVGQALGPGVEALPLAARGELEQAEALARAGVAAADTETDNPWPRAGPTRTSLRARALRSDRREACEALSVPSPSGSGSRSALRGASP